MKVKIAIGAGILFIVAVIVLIFPRSSSAAYSNGYGYAADIAVVPSQVSTSSADALTNFPMLISGTYSYLAASSSGGYVQNANGDDIIFTSDASGTQPLDWEQESYTSSTGAVIYWVKIPNLTSSTQIYMFYDNPGITTFQGNASATWNSNYVGVYHFGTSTLSGLDSTGNAYNGTFVNSPTATSGIIGNALSFNAASSQLMTNSNFTLPMSIASSGVSVSFWVEGIYPGVTPTFLIGTSSIYFWSSQSQATTTCAVEFYGSLKGCSFTTSGIGHIVTSSLPFYYITLEIATGGGFNLYQYINGGLDQQLSISGVPTSSLPGLSLGGSNLSFINSYSTGLLDEFEVSDTALPADWVQTAYNNQGFPSTFYTITPNIENNNYPATGMDTLSCTISTTCNAPSVGVLFLASTTNSHAALASSSAFAQIVCCTGVNSLGKSCSPTLSSIPFLHLASSTNSHSEINTQFNYPVADYACLSVPSGGGLSVGYTNTTTCTGAGYNTTLVSIASSTNAHVAQAGVSQFQAGATMQVCASASDPPPAVSNVVLNGGNPITLTPNATTSVNLSYTVSDYTANGCSDVFTYGTVTSTAFLDTVSSTCESSPTVNNLNCYVASLAGTTNSCGGSTATSANATDTFNIYYLARSSGNASSSFPNDHWYGYVSVKSQSSVTSTATSSQVDINVLSAIGLNTGSINFGTVLPNANTLSVNQTVVVSNVGNSSNTPELSGTTFVHGANSFATSSEHYATSSFTFGGSEQQMNTSPTTIPGVILTAPTVANNNPSSTIYFGLQVPFAVASGTYTATDTVTSLFSN